MFIQLGNMSLKPVVDASLHVFLNLVALKVTLDYLGGHVPRHLLLGHDSPVETGWRIRPLHRLHLNLVPFWGCRLPNAVNEI